MKLKSKSGQGMTEYIIIVALIAIALIAIIGLFGGNIKDAFSRSGQALEGTSAEAGDVMTEDAGVADDMGSFTAEVVAEE